MANHPLGDFDFSDHALGVMAMVARMTDRWTFVRLGVWWFPFNALWTALLTQGMQVRVEHLAPSAFKGEYLAVLSAVGASVALLSQLVAGALSDRCSLPWGRRRPFLLLGVIGSLPFLFGFISSPSFSLALFCFASLQAFLNIAVPAMRAFLPDLISPKKHGVASAHIGLWTLAGQVLGIGAIGTVLSPSFWHRLGFYSVRRQAEIWGLSLFALTVASLLLIATFLALTLPDRPSQGHRRPLSETLRKGYQIAWRDYASFGWLLASRFTINIGFYTAIVFLRWFLSDTLQVSDPAKATRTLGLLVTFASIPGIWVGGKLADTWSKRNLCLVTALFAGIGSFFFALAPSYPMTFLPAVLFGLGSAMFGVANWALAVNLMPRGEGGKFFALFQFAFTVPQILGPLLGGLLGGVINRALGEGSGWRWVFLLCLSFMLLGAFLLLKVRERKV